MHIQTSCKIHRRLQTGNPIQNAAAQSIEHSGSVVLSDAFSPSMTDTFRVRTTPFSAALPKHHRPASCRNERVVPSSEILSFLERELTDKSERTGRRQWNSVILRSNHHGALSARRDLTSAIKSAITAALPMRNKNFDGTRAIAEERLRALSLPFLLICISK